MQKFRSSVHKTRTTANIR
uniref:Uncharacterized protein n=1 Tax=Rhizophora mucronata TaxID=61149 RepID=A0A2P2NLJ2_RHIMU